MSVIGIALLASPALASCGTESASAPATKTQATASVTTQAPRQSPKPSQSSKAVAPRRTSSNECPPVAVASAIAGMQLGEQSHMSGADAEKYGPNCSYGLDRFTLGASSGAYTTTNTQDAEGTGCTFYVTAKNGNVTSIGADWGREFHSKDELCTMARNFTARFFSQQ